MRGSPTTGRVDARTSTALKGEKKIPAIEMLRIVIAATLTTNRRSEFIPIRGQVI
jgi:hypothetical protein